MSEDGSGGPDAGLQADGGQMGDRLARSERVSIRAVVVNDGEDATKALFEAGIYQPVAVHFVVDDGSAGSGADMMDAITPRISGTLEFETGPRDGGAAEPSFSPDPGTGQSGPSESASQTEHGDAPPHGRDTTALPVAYGTASLAPVWKRRR